MINFLKYRFVYLAISLVVILSGVFSIVRWGYRYAIDFTGGTVLELQSSKSLTEQSVKEVFASSKVEIVSLQVRDKQISAKLKPLENSKDTQIKDALEKKVKGAKISILRSETVGPALGKEAIQKTLVASAIAIVGILLYMSFAFKGFTFAFAAIIAMIHDLLVILGTYSILSHFAGAEFDTLFVTALLTTMSFSVHDTIIIFDKIREYKRVQGAGNMAEYANQALTETLIRSLNNSMTIIFMLLALTLLGGVTIRFFAATLLIGTITGTYSSPFVATPVLVWLEKRKKS